MSVLTMSGSGAMSHQQIHAKALKVAAQHQCSVSETIDILQEVDAGKTYLVYECASLYRYALQHLKLSEDTAVNYIAIARKAVEVPALKHELRSGAISTSKARKIVSVISVENQEDWLELARTLTFKELEREVAQVNPREAVNERLTYVTGVQLRLVVGVSEEFAAKLKRAQDLVSNSNQSAASFEQTLEAALDLFLERRDPMQRAQRNAAKAMAKTVEKAAKQTIAVKEQASRVCIDQQSREAKEIQAAPECQDSQKSQKSQKPQKPQKSIEQKDSTAVHAALPHATWRIELESFTRRKPIPAQTKHQLILRDQSRCTHHDSHGNRCEQTRWLDFHHRKAVSQGGDNNIANLTTLCSLHHARLHQSSLEM